MSIVEPLTEAQVEDVLDKVCLFLGQAGKQDIMRKAIREALTTESEVPGGAGFKFFPVPGMLIPAFGRDYSSRFDLYNDWANNVKFAVFDTNNPLHGKVVNNATFRNAGVAPGTPINIRFDSLRNVCTVVV